jgi:hypothetical protein
MGNAGRIEAKSALKPQSGSGMLQFEFADVALEYFMDQVLYFLDIHECFLWRWMVVVEVSKERLFQLTFDQTQPRAPVGAE